MPQGFQAHVGSSSESDPFDAGRDAARSALGDRAGGKLALVCASADFDHERVLAGIVSILGTTPIFGASSFAEVSSDGYQEDSVVVTLLDGDFRFVTSADVYDGSPAGAGRKVADACVRQLEGRRVDLALVFCSCESGEASSVVDAVKDVVGESVIVFGGGSGPREVSPGEYDRSYQYADGRILHTGVALLLLTIDSPDVKLVTAVSHGLQPISNPMRITRADGHYVYEVDGENVFKFYEKYLGQRIEEVGPLIRTYPFLVAVPGHEETLARVPVFIDRENGRIGFFPTDSMQDQTVSLAHFTRNGIVRACRDSAYNAKVRLGDARPRLMFAVSCGERMRFLGPRVVEEAETLFDVFGQVPLAGLYSGAEVVPILESAGSEAPHSTDSHVVGETFCLLVIGDRTPAADPAAYTPRRQDSCELPETPEEAIACAREEIAYLRQTIEDSERLLDVREQVLLKINRENIEITNELRHANLQLSELNRLNTRLQEIIRQYTPRTTWKKAGKLAGEGGLAIPDETADLAYLFLDVKGFTPYSETHTPEEVISSLNAILGPCTDIIYENAGDVQKYIGDAIFATFPQATDAVEAALAICRAIARVETEFKIRIGINAGRSVAGNVGSELRRDNTMIGDAVNLSQRLESACQPGGVLLSKEVHDRVKDKLRLEGAFKEIQVKGKAKPIEVFEVDVRASAYGR